MLKRITTQIFFNLMSVVLLSSGTGLKENAFDGINEHNKHLSDSISSLSVAKIPEIKPIPCEPVPCKVIPCQSVPCTPDIRIKKVYRDTCQKPFYLFDYYANSKFLFVKSSHGVDSTPIKVPHAAPIKELK